MEILGAVASSIAVGQMIVAGRHVVNLIQQIPEIPNEFNELRDEIRLIDGIAKSVKKLLDATSSPERDSSDHNNLLVNRALQQMNAIVVDLEQIVTSCARTPTSTKPSFVKRRKWILQEGKIEKLISKAVNAKINLHFVMSICDRERDARQEQALAEILHRFESFRTQNFRALPPVTFNEIEEPGGKLSVRTWSETEETSDNLNEEPQRSVALERDPHPPPAKQKDALWLHSIVPLQEGCKKSCRCRCHFSSKTSSAAAWLRPLLGSYLVQYNTVPGLRKLECTEPTCVRGDDSYLRLEYRFPWWLSAGMASFVASFNGSTRINCAIRPKRTLGGFDIVWSQIRLPVEEFRQFILNNEQAKYFPGDEDESGEGLIEFAISLGQFDTLELLLGLWKDILPQYKLPATVGFAVRRRLKYHRIDHADRETNLLQQAISWVNDDIDTRRTRVFKVLLQGEDVGQALIEEPWAVNVIDSELGIGPLHIVTERGQSENLKQLIAAGANVDLKDCYGWTPLMLAANDGNVEFLQLLLHAGSCTRQKNRDGDTALHLAVPNGLVEVVSILLEAGAPLTVANIVGETPLHYLRHMKRGIGLETVDALVNRLVTAKVSNIEVRNSGGFTPIMSALVRNNLSVFDCLLQAGGSEHSIGEYSRNVLHLAALYASLDTLLYLDSLQLTLIDTEKYDDDGDTPWRCFRYTNDNPAWALRGFRKPTVHEQAAFLRLWMGIRDRNLQLDIQALQQIFVALKGCDIETASTKLNALITLKQDRNWDENGVLSWYRAISGLIRAGNLTDATKQIEAAIKDFKAEMGTYPWGGKPETSESRLSFDKVEDDPDEDGNIKKNETEDEKKADDDGEDEAENHDIKDEVIEGDVSSEDIPDPS